MRLAVRRAQLLHELGVGPALNRALLVEQRKHPEALFLGEKREDVGIVGVAHTFPRDALLGVERLLGAEDVGAKVLLQALVRKVDAELLERVGRERLESEDVEHSNRAAHLRWRGSDGQVALGDEPAEEAAVERLAEGVARVGALRGGERHHHHLLPRHQTASAQRCAEVVRRRYAEQFRHARERNFAARGHDARALRRG